MASSPEHFWSRIQPRALSAVASANLDLIRAVAASAVMWGHLRGLFFVDFQQIPKKNTALSSLYFLTGFGHESVMVFFVLSGFLISSSILRSQAQRTWSWTGYAINRATRLYVVLIPGLLFGAVWDLAGNSLFASTGLYSLPLPDFGGLVVRNQLTAGNFFGTLFFLQTIACNTFGSNGPLWSIANEFWYYVLFPIGLLAYRSWTRASVAAIVPTIFALAVAWMLGPAKMLGFVVWVAGFVVAVLWGKLQWSKIGWQAVYLLASSAALIACLVASRTGKFTPFESDLWVGLTFSVFLLAVLQLSTKMTVSQTYSQVAHLLARFSYSLYVLHFPFLFFLRAWLVPGERWQPDGRHLFYGTGIGLATVAFAWVVALGTEFRTTEIRRAIRKWLHTANPDPVRQ
jgi:peptidoglycan/LPS O-acetylase OafA/YrhL